MARFEWMNEARKLSKSRIHVQSRESTLWAHTVLWTKLRDNYVCWRKSSSDSYKGIDLVKDKVHVSREFSTAPRSIGYQGMKDWHLHALEATIHCTRTQITHACKTEPATLNYCQCGETNMNSQAGRFWTCTSSVLRPAVVATASRTS